MTNKDMKCCCDFYHLGRINQCPCSVHNCLQSPPTPQHTPTPADDTGAKEFSGATFEQHHEHGAPNLTIEGVVGRLRGLPISDKEIEEMIVDFVHDELKTFQAHTIQETSKAFGGCTSCYGKGYATQIERYSGRGVEIAAPYYLPCRYCARGKQIEEMITKIKQERNKEILAAIEKKLNHDSEVKGYEIMDSWKAKVCCMADAVGEAYEIGLTEIRALIQNNTI